MNKNYYLEELTKKVDSLEKRIKVLEKLLSGDSK
jgi:chaperonin cofactor prefoldin|tara:strand:- start:71 stop:172 length:102 start_codon:yes stop_codon:yes gene_type:complete